MDIEKLWARRWIRWSLIAAGWTLFGLFLASQTYLAYSRRDWLKGSSAYRILGVELAYGYLWAAITPLVLWLARRFRIERERWFRSLLVHIFVSLFIGITTRIIHDLMFFYFVGESSTPLSLTKLLMNVYMIFDYGALIYWLILLITYAFEYYRRYREGEIRTSRLGAQLAHAQLEALKMQLQPHFLFNTLNSISALLHKNVNAADTMIAQLGDFLRLTLENAGTHEVSLQEELEFLKCYLAIERIRFEDRLRIRITAEREALDALLPNLILQPIVENAIRHGIAPRSVRGVIDVRARRQDGVLQVEVSDNGPGLPTNGKSSGVLREGLGLANTQARLEQLYGSAHRLDLENAPEGGLTVILEIPFKTEPNRRVERYGLLKEKSDVGVRADTCLDR
jgi:two-component system, LytTR family, sensor kinase